MKNILIFNWKDIAHPQAGGAEIVTHEIAKRAVQNGDNVVMLVARPEGMKEKEIIDGVQIIRVGGRFSHYWKAYRYYKDNLETQFDIVIEEVNTLPYFTNLYAKKEKNFLFYHQLAREVWFYQMPQPISSVGFMLEPIYTWLRSRGNNTTITISNSTKTDLLKYGFAEKNVKIIREGILNKPVEKIDFNTKEKKFTVLFHSALREMKRPEHAVEAFCIFLESLSSEEKEDVQMWVSGGGPLRKQCEAIVEKYNAGKYNAGKYIEFFGRTTDEQMYDLMERASVLLSSSVKEGWGLIVTEANSFGTPALSYDVDGLRDSTALGEGILTESTPKDMAEGILKMKKLFDTDFEKYKEMCNTAWNSSKDITFENCFADFNAIITK